MNTRSPPRACAHKDGRLFVPATGENGALELEGSPESRCNRVMVDANKLQAAQRSLDPLPPGYHTFPDAQDGKALRVPVVFADSFVGGHGEKTGRLYTFGGQVGSTFTLTGATLSEKFGLGPALKVTGVKRTGATLEVATAENGEKLLSLSAKGDGAEELAEEWEAAMTAAIVLAAVSPCFPEEQPQDEAGDQDKKPPPACTDSAWHGWRNFVDAQAERGAAIGCYKILFWCPIRPRWGNYVCVT